MPYDDYTNRLPIETVRPRLPGQDTFPFTATPQPRRQFLSDQKLAEVGDYALAFKDYFYVFDFRPTALIIPAFGTRAIPKRMFNDQFFAAMLIVIVHQVDESENIQGFDFQLSDEGQGLSYFDEPVPSILIAGTATDPFWFPNMVVFGPNSTLTVTVTDTSGAENSPKILIGGRRYHT